MRSAEDTLTPLGQAGEPRDAVEYIASMGLRVAPGPSARVGAVMIGSLDGRATADGRSRGLGHPADRAQFRELRTIADALLVGRATLTAERYANLLDPDQRERRVAEGRAPHPLVATLTRDPQSLADVPLVHEDGVPVVIYTPKQPDTAGPGNADVRVIADVGLPAVIADLHERDAAGVIVCEGGPSLLRDLAAADGIDDLLLTLAPMIVAGDGPSIVTGPALAPPPRLRLAGIARADEHLMLHYVR